MEALAENMRVSWVLLGACSSPQHRAVPGFTYVLRGSCCVVQSLTSGLTRLPLERCQTCSGACLAAAAALHLNLLRSRELPHRLKANGGQLLDAQHVAQLPTLAYAQELLAPLLLSMPGQTSPAAEDQALPWPPFDAEPSVVVATAQQAHSPGDFSSLRQTGLCRCLQIQLASAQAS